MGAGAAPFAWLSGAAGVIIEAVGVVGDVDVVAIEAAGVVGDLDGVEIEAVGVVGDIDGVEIEAVDSRRVAGRSAMVAEAVEAS